MFKMSDSKFKKKSTHNKLMKYFILFAIGPSIIISSIYYFFSASYINQVTTELGISMITRVSSELESFFDSIIRVGDIAAANQRIQMALRNEFEGDLQLRYSSDLENDVELYFANYMEPNILGLNILGENHSEFKSHNRTFKNQVHTEQDWYKKIRDSEDYVWFPPHSGQFATISTDERVISCGRPIIDKTTGRVTGIVLIDINESIIRDIISTKLGKSGYLLILDDQYNIIYSPAQNSGAFINLKDLIGDNTEGALVTNMIMEKPQGTDAEKVIATYKTMPKTGWKVIGIIPMGSLNRGNEILAYITVAILIIITIFAFFKAAKVSKDFTVPLTNLMLAMKRVERKDLIINTGSEGYVEVEELKGSFNMMVNEIQTLMESLYEKQNKLRKAELKALQAQINPHFLYNTLDAILWLNLEGKRSEIQVLVESLTALFRISISRGKDIISLKEELDHLESYLKIQSIRYGDKFDYFIDIDENLYSNLIPKLVLQPLVENSVYHGIKRSNTKGNIWIKAVDKENKLEISIQDTGAGMADEKLQLLNKCLEGEDVKDMHAYGIKNVNERLKIFLGEEAMLIYESQVGVGTTVTMHIPKIIVAIE